MDLKHGTCLPLNFDETSWLRRVILFFLRAILQVQTEILFSQQLTENPCDNPAGKCKLLKAQSLIAVNLPLLEHCHSSIGYCNVVINYNE